jgi:GLPGLI family protein
MENGKMHTQELPDTSTIIAWYAPDIPVAAGPEGNSGLPGLILELEENNGRSVLKAVEISPKVNVASIREPKSGKRISAEAFRKEQQAWMAEMQERMQSGGRVSMPMPPGN